MYADNDLDVVLINFVKVFINVPWWYLAFNRMISPFLTQRTKSKFVFAGPSKSAETLFKYVIYVVLFCTIVLLVLFGIC